MTALASARRPRSWWAGVAIAAACVVLWQVAAARARRPDATALGATPAARAATLARALPVGTSLDSARIFLRAHRLDFAQGRATSGGLALVVWLPPASGAGAGRITLEFDARRRLVRQRTEPAVAEPAAAAPRD